MKTCFVFWLLPLLGVMVVHGQPSLSVGNARGYPGQAARVPISVRQATNVVAVQFDLAYNTAKGLMHEAELGGTFHQSYHPIS